MQRWERPRHRRPVLPTLTTKPSTCHQPSFSSTLLDAIYRSMDDDAPPGPPTREPPRRVTVDTAASMRSSTATTEKRVTGRHAGRSPANSVSTSSVSTVGRFSSSSSSSFSSESDSAALPAPPNPRPIQTSNPSGRTPKQSNPEGRKKASEGSTPLRKTKPPLSPGARLASFLTNLFTASGNPKKVKANTSASGRTPPSGSSASKSSVGYYSDGAVGREKTPSPAAVIRVGEVPRSAAAEKRAVEGARELVRRYTEIKMGVDEEEEEEDEEDGRGSCSSSELFELENLAGMGELAGVRVDAFGDEPGHRQGPRFVKKA